MVSPKHTTSIHCAVRSRIDFEVPTELPTSPQAPPLEVPSVEARRPRSKLAGTGGFWARFSSSTWGSPGVGPRTTAKELLTT